MERGILTQLQSLRNECILHRVQAIKNIQFSSGIIILLAKLHTLSHQHM